MGLSDDALKRKREYIHGYAKKHYKRVTLDIEKKDFEKIERAAKLSGESVSGYIKNAIRQRLDNSD